ncbi:MAG TPA: hypothetical protein VIW70_09605 [Rubrivivax sp.]
MSQSITTKAVSLGIAAMVTLTIMMSMDALATSQQSTALMAGGGASQTACLAPVSGQQS